MKPNIIQLNVEKDFIQWNSNFEIGLPVIDAQHKHLVELCNNLYRDIMKINGDDATWKSAVEHSLHECVDYVKEHFSNEEKIMQAVSYEGYEAHKKMHETFTWKILETSAMFPAMDVSEAIKFVKFLYDWILEHVAHVDKLYVPLVSKYLAEKN